MNTASDYKIEPVHTDIETNSNSNVAYIGGKPDASAVSWGAILAGAVGAASLSLILLILGTGLGLASVSPWTGDGISSTTFGVSTILWITFTQIAAAGMGGYLAGRLRTRWLNTHGDEVYFRDTAHGFLAWAVATLLTAGLMTSAISSIISGGVKAATAGAGVAAVAAGTAAQDDKSTTMNYFVDKVFRSTNTAPVVEPGSDSAVISATAPISSPVSSDASAEVNRIFANALLSQRLSQIDAEYLASIVAARTGLSQQQAEKRVNDTYAQFSDQLKVAEASAKAAADKARKASSYAALWLFISLLIGAFVASWVATYGGRQRDA